MADIISVVHIVDDIYVLGDLPFWIKDSCEDVSVNDNVVDLLECVDELKSIVWRSRFDNDALIVVVPDENNHTSVSYGNLSCLSDDVQMKIRSVLDEV